MGKEKDLFKSSHRAEQEKVAEAKFSPTSISASAKKPPVFKRILSLLKNKELYIIFGIVAILLIAVGGITFLLWGFMKPLFVWVFSLLLIFFTRRTDLWYMGIEVHFFLTFALAYVFGPWFALSIIYLAFYAVFKVRPDQFHGVMIQGVSLTVVAVVSHFVSSSYGAGIMTSKFVLIAIITIIAAQLLDGFLSITFCPAPPIKVFIMHTLDVVINYFFISFAGFKLLAFLFLMT